jgi:hypothetical protein
MWCKLECIIILLCCDSLSAARFWDAALLHVEPALFEAICAITGLIPGAVLSQSLAGAVLSAEDPARRVCCGPCSGVLKTCNRAKLVRSPGPCLRLRRCLLARLQLVP